MTLPNLINDPDTTDMGPSNLWREVRSNARDSLLDRGQNVSLNVDTTAGGTIVLTVAQREPVQLIRLTGTPGAAYTVEFADGSKQIEIENVSGQSATIDTTTGAASPPVIATAKTALLQIRDTEITLIGVVNFEIGALLHSGQVNPTANFNFLDKKIKQALLKDYSVEVTSPSSSSGTLNLDMENGNVFDVTLTEAVTTLNFNNPATGSANLLLEDGSGSLLLEDGSGVLLLEESDAVGNLFLIAKQDGTGGWAITFPDDVIWERDTGGTPDQTLTANAVEIDWFFTKGKEDDSLLILEDGVGNLLTEDGGGHLLLETASGLIWYGHLIGLDMK